MIRDWRLPAAPLPAARPAVQPWTLSWPLVTAGLTLAALALRLALWDRFPLREDEALYVYWARTLAEVDPLLLAVWPDKPPLLLWGLAGVTALLGHSDAALRWLNIAASVLSVPLAAVAAQRVWGTPAAGTTAALLLTLSPFAVSFAPTVYTDPLLTLCGMAAITLALHRRPGWAGVALAAAIMTKQQGLLYAPLILALLLLAPGRGRALARLLLGCAFVVLPVLAWDSARWAVAPSPWDLARHTYAPLTLLPSDVWPARGRAWADLLWYLGGSWPAWTMLAGALLAALVQARRRPALAWLLAWGGGVILLHIAVSFQVWDRYLLPLAPWLALVAAGPLAQALAATRQALPVASLAVALTFTPPALTAAHGGFPIGADHGDHQGLREAVAWLRAQPGPMVLYHQALGWHYRAYLFDELQPVTAEPLAAVQPPRLELRWFPSAVYLADNAAKTPYPPKYLVLPDWAPQADLSLHLAWRGLTLETRLRAGRFSVVEISRPSPPVCTWCVSRPPVFGSVQP